MRYFKCFFILTMLAVTSVTAMAQELYKVWSSDPVLNVPESVLYDNGSDQLFVANIQGRPADKDGNGFISLMSKDGELIEKEWMKGLSAPKGMAIDSVYLYVSDVNELVIIDIRNRQIHNRIARADAKFLNDVALSANGRVFVSDMLMQRVMILRDGKLDVWLEGPDFEGANGLYYEDDHLLVGTSKNILKVSLVDKSYHVLVENSGPVDGLMADGEGGYFFSHWEGRLFHVIPNEEPVELLNTVDVEINCADIGYNPTTKHIYVPTFFKNTVVAYRYGAGF